MGRKQRQTYTTEVREIRHIVNPLEQMDDIRAAVCLFGNYAPGGPRIASLYGAQV